MAKSPFDGITEFISQDIRKQGLEMARQYVEKGFKCIVCGKPAEAAGAYTPSQSEQQAYGAAPDKFRVFFYPVCLVCNKNIENRQIIKDQILKGFVTEH